MLPLVEERIRRRGGAWTQAIIVASQGDELSDEEAQSLERRLVDDPENENTRACLLGYYFTRQFKSAELKGKRAEAILWLIRNKPESIVLSTPYAKLETDAIAYEEARDAWLDALHRRGETADLLENAALFLQHRDPELALSLWLRADQSKEDTI
jgi:hypothetical protein